MWNLEVGGGLPSQAASHVPSEQSTFVPNEQSIVTWLLPKCLTATINIPHLEKLPWISLRTVLAANLRTNLLQSSCLQADWANLLDRVERLAEYCKQVRRCIPS